VYRILLVDDEATVRRVMRMSLEKAGFEVTAAENGEVALAELRKSEPDVLITDIEMPRMNGRALCAAVEKEFPNRQFPIFVVTSLTEREHRRWSTLVSNLYFVEKPISVRKLIVKLNDYLRENGVAVGSA